MPRAATEEAGRQHSTEGVDLLHDVTEQAGRVLDQLRGTIDALSVQLALADLDARDEFRMRVDTAESAYWTARSHLADVRRDGRSSLGTLKKGVETLVGDLRLANEAAKAVVRRRGDR
jgi:hypothetical protein